MFFPRPRDRNDFEIAIICALPLEYNAATLIFDEFWDENGQQYGRAIGDANIYTAGRVGSHNVILTLLPNVGKRNAARVVAGLRASYRRLRLALLVGVCGGVPQYDHKEIFLGDVVISNSVIQFDSGRNPHNLFAKNTVQDNPGPPNRSAIDLFGTLESDLGLDQLSQNTNTALQAIRDRAHKIKWLEKYDYPGSDQDKLYESTYRHMHQRPSNCLCRKSFSDADPVCNESIGASCANLGCEDKYVVKRQRPDSAQNAEKQKDEHHKLQVHVGPVGSGDAVIKSAAHRDHISQATGVIAFEMEGSGVWDEVPSIIVQGVCDYADGHKDRKWQVFAAATAASAAKAVLEGYIETDKTMEMNERENRKRPQPVGLVEPKARWDVPFARNKGFVGREDVMSPLLQRVTPAAVKGSCQRTVIQGPAGIGKTQIALEVASRLRATNSECSVFWVNATDAVTFGNSYHHIGQTLKVPGIDENRVDIIFLVKAALERNESGQWLLIVDNADDVELLSQPTGITKYLPSNKNGSILFTTRSRDLSVRLEVGSQGVFSVSKMTNDESVELLETRLSRSQTQQDLESTVQLVEFLDNLPLALKLAAAYMDRVRITTRTYLRHCRSGDTAFSKLLSKELDDNGRSDDVRNSVTIAWLISFDRVSKDYPRAVEYLKCMSFLSEKEIPQALLPPTRSKTESDEAIEVLKSFAFVSEQDGLLNMHRPVRLAMRNWLEQTGNAQKTYNTILRHFAMTYPSPNHENREIWTAYLPHVRSALEYGEKCDEEHGRSTLLFHVAKSLLILGHYPDAERLLRETLDLKYSLLFGDENLETIRCMNCLGIVLEKQGKYKEAEQIHQHAMDLCTKRFGQSHPQTLKSMNNLAVVLDRQEKYHEAEQVYRLVLEYGKSVPREEQPKTSVAVKHIGIAMRKQGKHSEAEGLFRQTLKHEERTVGREHPDYLITMSHLAITLQAQGKSQEAEETQRSVLELRMKIMGKEHPDIVQSMRHLALILEQQGQEQEAKDIFEQAAILGQKTLGMDHPETVQCLQGLERMNQKRKRSEGSERL